MPLSIRHAESPTVSSGSNDRVFLSATRVARQLGMHESTVRRWWREGVLPYVTIAGRRRIHRDDLKAWIQKYRYFPAIRERN